MWSYASFRHNLYTVFFHFHFLLLVMSLQQEAMHLSYDTSENNSFICRAVPVLPPLCN